MKNPTKKEIEDSMLTSLNDFMKDYNIKEINFGKTHSIKKTKGKKAKDIIKNKKSLKKLNMEDLKKALELKNKYNKMPFDDFVIELEKYLGYEIPQKEKDIFKYCGLLNHDFFMMFVDVK